ncbi:MAG TPA: hypothetical protein VGK67_11775 [Myxococcales bacterium]|jgi:hypothetical protein
MRHPALRLFQLLCAATVTVIAAIARPLPPPPERPVWMSVLGESERADGSWAGVDLLQTPDASIDRFQITLRPERAVRVRLEAVTDGQTEQLYPAHAGDAVLGGGRSWAMPGPRSFFEVRGHARLRLVVAAENNSPGADIPARLSGAVHAVTLPLTDGSAAKIGERSLVVAAAGQAVLEVPLYGR